jgi:hypothetical protein
LADLSRKDAAKGRVYENGISIKIREREVEY